MRVAIVHDWLVGGGAEKVVEQLHEIYPDAPIYTTYTTDEWRKKLDYKVVTGPLQSWPLSKLRKFLPLLRIWWFVNLKLDKYDLVISSTGAEAKGINTKPGTFHISYIHAPTHYYWSRYDEYLKNPGFGAFDWLARIGLKLLVGPLRRWDFVAAQKPDYLIANSTHTQSEIKKYYGRDSQVIYPPVDVERFNAAKSKKRNGFVITGRQTPYKRVDLAVAACTQLGVPLTVLGNGPDYKKLQSLAGPTITFITKPSDAEVVEYTATSEAFIFPGKDDFGIAPVEALAAGTPVIAYKAGGALDYVNEKTGVFFEEQAIESLIQALKNFDSQKYSPEDIKKAASKFSKANFRENVSLAVQKNYNN